jgi:hypothetical protein
VFNAVKIIEGSMMKILVLTALMLVCMLTSPICKADAVAEQPAAVVKPKATVAKPKATVAEPKATVVKAVSYSGGDGATMESAVVIEGANNSSAGIAAERKWVTEKYPGFKKVQQSLLHKEGKSYDLIEIETADGKSKSIYFDISGFFGKW